jgi:hypothetical protein
MTACPAKRRSRSPPLPLPEGLRDALGRVQGYLAFAS